MSIAFKNIKTKIGLDDVLDFGKYRGNSVIDLIHSRNGYIDWLISQGTQFYPSVHQELQRHPFVLPGPKGDRGRKRYFYDGLLRGVISHHQATCMQEWLDDPIYLEGFDDVPF
jgi:hypothetical protein